MVTRAVRGETPERLPAYLPQPICQKRETDDAAKSSVVEQEDEEIEDYEPDEDEPAPAHEDPSLFLGNVLASRVVMPKKKAAAKKKPSLVPPASEQRGHLEQSPVPSASRKRTAQISRQDSGLDLDPEMSKVNEKLGGGKRCLESLSVVRHLAGEKLGVRVQAKGLLESLNSMRPLPKEAVLLEHRIAACEYGSLLANHARTANTDVLQKAVDCMMQLDITLPTSIAAQLIERRVDEHMLIAAKDPRKLDVKYYISLIVLLGPAGKPGEKVNELMCRDGADDDACAVMAQTTARATNVNYAYQQPGPYTRSQQPRPYQRYAGENGAAERAYHEPGLLGSVPLARPGLVVRTLCCAVFAGVPLVRQAYTGFRRGFPEHDQTFVLGSVPLARPGFVVRTLCCAVFAGVPLVRQAYTGFRRGFPETLPRDVVVKPEFILPEVDYHKLNYSTLVDVVKKRVLAQMQDATGEDAAKIKEAADEEWQADGMIGLLQDAPKTSDILISLFTKLLTELNQNIITDNLEDLDVGVVTSLQAVKLCSHCFLALLHPQPGYHGSNAGHVGSVRSYKGKDSMLQTANKIVTKPFWQEKHDEMLKKAGSSKVAEPVCKEAFDGLENLTSTSSPQDVSAALGFAVQKLPELRTAMRAGATNALESCMLEVAKSSLKEILESDGSSQPPRLIDDLDRALPNMMRHLKLKAFSTITGSVVSSRNSESA
ncbi:unnamed protein product [Symbiodinium sp. CCMP2592]|nr:unnamed protein product [Symbiodinium sp. CCMP2592]